MSWQTPDGASISTPRKERSTPEEDRRIIGVLMLALKSQGWSYTKIGRTFNTSDVQVRRIIKRVPSNARALCG